jgi:hypothetical protein
MVTTEQAAQSASASWVMSTARRRRRNQLPKVSLGSVISPPHSLRQPKARQ